MLELSLKEVTKNLERVGGDEIIKENKRLSQLVEKVEQQANDQRANYE